jgi:hypothetical protein
MANEAEDLLRRTQRLREQIEERKRKTAQTFEELGWLARAIRNLRDRYRAVREIARVLAPVLRPFALVLGPAWRVLRFTLLYATCNRDASGLRSFAGFSARRLAVSSAAALAAFVLATAAYAYGTRHSGRFIISNYQLVDIGEDAYQVGGCPKRRPDQIECDPGASEIMLVQPDWLSTLAQALGAKEGVLGIDAFLFDEIAGGIPHQGECELTRYGIYLRPPPLFRLLRGAIKPHVVHVGTCEVYGIRGELERREP